MSMAADTNEFASRLLNAPIEEKIKWIQTDYWVHTPSTKAAFQWMEYLCRSERSIQPVCLQLMGDGGMGKTATLLAFQATHPVEKCEDPLRLRRPVLFAEAKSEPSGVAGVRHAILKGAWPEATNFACTEGEVDTTLRTQSVRIVLMDELGELTKSGAGPHRKALSELKRISNTSRVNIVASTVSNLAHVLDVDQQFAGRFRRKIRIPVWSLSQDLLNFVFGLERNLPFPERSSLYGSELLPWLALNGEGNTKIVIELVRLAALHALGEQSSCIKLKHLLAAKDGELPPAIALSAVA